MSKKDISKFLPKHLRNEDVRSFISTTTQTLFDEEQSEYVNQYIGRKVGGTYSHTSDPYAVERTKLRQDYRLEPALVSKDAQSGDINSILFYEDLLHSLRSSGVDVSSHERLFGGDAYTFAPPIDYDMFINYTNYYWLPEGVPAVRILANKTDLEGSTSFTAIVNNSNASLEVSNGSHVVLNDNKEYIVTGVGEKIKLVEFDPSSNKPMRISLRSGGESYIPTDLFPKEYISIERGSIDQSPWTNNNAWYHVDVVYPDVPTVRTIDLNIEDRRASRPIIQYRRNIELYNYVNGAGYVVDARHDGNDVLPHGVDSEIDGIRLFEGMQVIREDNFLVYTFDGGVWRSSPIGADKVVVSKGNSHRGEELSWSTEGEYWTLLQRKVSDTQSILFNLYNGNDLSTAVPLAQLPSSNFQGVSIFGYKTSGGSLVYDRELGMNVSMHTTNTGSDFVFSSTMSEYVEANRRFVDEFTDGVFYKLVSDLPLPENRFYEFTINSNSAGEARIFVNGDEMPSLTVESSVAYTLDFSDSSTTRDGKFQARFPISITEVETDTPMVQYAQGSSSKTQYSVRFKDYHTYVYSTKVDGKDIEGFITVQKSNREAYLLNEYQRKRAIKTRLKQEVEITKPSSQNIVTLEYNPTSDSIVSVLIDGLEAQVSVIGNRVEIDSTLIREGSFVEIEYETFDSVSDSRSVIQLPPIALTNNPFNVTPTSFKYSDVFSHMGDVISRQKGFVGSSFGSNNYRDSFKDYATGGTIVKHESSIVPLMFLNKNDNTSIRRAIDTSRMFYQHFKNQLVLEAEEYLRGGDINTGNLMDVFDNLVTRINMGKVSASPFSSTRMFASDRSFVELSVDEDGVFNTVFELTDASTLYIHLIDRGIARVDEDYDLVPHEGTYRIEAKTFSLGDIVSVRLYPEIGPCYCPATPQKIGLLPSHTPRLVIEDGHEKPVVILVGHDGSKTLAYTKMSDYLIDNIDIRDSILMEFETRIYNGIREEFRRMDFPIVDIAQYVSSPYRSSIYEKESVSKIENEIFFKWCNDNNVDYSENRSFVEGNPWTYNYAKTPAFDGRTLRGHWRGIYQDYYGTESPHRTPWEMLGFHKKPVWWDDTYGSDYSSANTAMWYDLENGIIRSGLRANEEALQYLYDNPYRRVGLSDILPVDDEGKLLDPISAGIVGAPEQSTIREKWKLGDCAPVERAWRTMSDYQFTQMTVLYTLRPAEFCSKFWDTTKTLRGDYSGIWEYPHSLVHNDTTYVNGISLWVHDLLRSDNFDSNEELRIPYENMDMSLSYKVGGYVNRTELRLSSESNSPTDNSSVSSSIPSEDINVLVYQSKDIAEKVYSGVIVERIDMGREKKPFVAGTAYKKDDIIYVDEERTFYRKIETIDVPAWEGDTDYRVGDEVQFSNIQYVCSRAHRAIPGVLPAENANWKLRGFKTHEWVVLINAPKATTTAYKVYGYDISQPYFHVIRPVKSNNVKTITAYGPKSKPVDVDQWVPNTDYRVGNIVGFNGSLYEAFLPHNSGLHFDSNNWTQLSEVPRTHKIEVDYYADGGFTVEKVEYHTVFRSIEDVVEFLTSYGRYLESEGWLFDSIDSDSNTRKNWVMSAKEFVEWAVENQHVGAVIALSPVSDFVEYKSSHGVVSLINQQNTSIYNILGFNGNPIDIDQIKITREFSKFRLRAEVPVYYLKVGIKEYEHTITVNNETIFGDIIYDPVLGTRVDRLWMRGTKTTNWDGRLYAPGFIITDDGITPNFDTAMKDITEFNDMSVVSSREVINELKYHNLGYQRRGYLEELKMDNKSQIDFYSGFIRQKGTSSSFTKILRSNVVNNDEIITVAEEWAFKENVFGGVPNYSQIEFYLKGDEFVNNPQKIRLCYNGVGESIEYGTISIRHDNDSEWLMHPTKKQDNGTLFTTTKPKYVYKDAGYALYDEHDVKTRDFLTLESRLTDMELEKEVGMTVWLSTDTTNGGSWSIYLLDHSRMVITEILDAGTEGVNGAIIRANNVHEDMPYLITDGSGDQRTVTLVHIREDIYILLDIDDTQYVELDEDMSPDDINPLQWKPLRISSDPVTRQIASVSVHLKKYDITPYEGMLVYKDEESYGVGNWQVYRFDGSEWASIRHGGDLVDNSLLHDMAMYDTDDTLIEYLRAYDPLMGLIPGARLDEIDIISMKDPVDYERRSTREYASHSDLVGKTWWDISELVYVNYHVGDTEYRENFWGTLFPDSEVVVYEWVRSSDKPEDYSGEVKNVVDFIEAEEYDYDLGIYTTYYYFWEKNRVEVDSTSDRVMSASQIANSIRYPSNNGFAMIALVDNHNVMVFDETQTMTMNDSIMKIGYKVRPTDTNTHTQWALVAESDTANNIPAFIFDRMNDSVIGIDRDGDKVPMDGLGKTVRYGNEKGQTWFKDRGAAMEIYLPILNEHLRRINIHNHGFGLDEFEVDMSTSQFINVDTWYSENYDASRPLSRVINSHGEIYEEANENGDYIRVIHSANSLDEWSVYEWVEEAKDVILVAKSNSIIQLNGSKVAGSLSKEERLELRKIIDIIFNEMTFGEYQDINNRILFAMVRYALLEHPNNDWVFPTTYISIVDDHGRMHQSETYRPSTISDVEKYIREAKPYHTKLRSYDRVNRPDDELVRFRVTDFDNPAYIADDNSIQFYTTKKIERFIPNGTTYQLKYDHTDEVIVIDDGTFVQRDQYSIEDGILRLNYTPVSGRNHVQSIVVDSRDMDEQEKQEQWIKSWGYAKYLRDTFNRTAWEDLSIQKHTTIRLDNNWFVNANTFEELVEVKRSSFDSFHFASLLQGRDSYSTDNPVPINVKDRHIALTYHDDMVEIANQSVVYHHTGEDSQYHVPYSGGKTGMVMLVDSKPIVDAQWWVTGNQAQTSFAIHQGSRVEIRPYEALSTLYARSATTEGLTQDTDHLAVESFTGGYTLPILAGHGASVICDDILDKMDVSQEVIFEEGTEYDEKVSNGSFTNINDNANDQHVGLRVHESLVMTFVNRVPQLNPFTHEESMEDRGYQEEVRFTIEEGKTEYEFERMVPSYFLSVWMGNTRLFENAGFTVTEKGIRILIDLVVGSTLVIMDSKDDNRDSQLTNDIVLTKRAGGGFIVNEELGAICEDENPMREFIVYTREGRKHFMRTRLYDYFRGQTFDVDENTLEFYPNDAEDITRTNKLFAIVYSQGSKLEDTDASIDFEFVRGTIKDNKLFIDSRGLLTGHQLRDSLVRSSKVYELHVEQEMDEYVLYDTKGGDVDNDNYPKLGHIQFNSSGVAVRA